MLGNVCNGATDISEPIMHEANVCIVKS